MVEERFDPLLGLVSHPVVVKLMEESCMGDFVKHLGKVQEDDVYLLPLDLYLLPLIEMSAIGL